MKAFKCFHKSSHVALLEDEPQPRKTRADFFLERAQTPAGELDDNDAQDITIDNNNQMAQLRIAPPPATHKGLLSESAPPGSYRIASIGRNQTEDTEENSTIATARSAGTSGSLNHKSAPPATSQSAYSRAEQEKDKASLLKWQSKLSGQAKQEEHEDALVAQARFEAACQLLHKQIMEKEHRLTVSERSFLHRLLDDNNFVDTESDISDRLSTIESSLHSLNVDPLFKTPPTSPEKMMRVKTVSRGVAITGRTFIPPKIRADRSHSSEDESGIEVLSSNSSQFSIEKALDQASKDKEDNDLFRSTDTFSQSGSFEHGLYTKFPKGDREDEHMAEPPIPFRSNTKRTSPAGSPSRRPPHERMNKVANENDDDSPCQILGTIPHNRILSASLMEALRGFLPHGVSEQNYWLKYDSRRDETTMTSLLTRFRASQNTIICIKATDGSVFGSFTSTPWRLQKGWYGMTDTANNRSNDSFLFRSLSGKMEVYPYTGSDDFVQYCSAQILAVGGGDWQQGDSPYSRHESHGIGLLIDGDLAGGESNSCATFANPRLFDTQDGDESRVGNEFVIENMEVWTLTPCQDVAAAEKLELRKLFLEKSATITTAT